MAALPNRALCAALIALTAVATWLPAPPAAAIEVVDGLDVKLQLRTRLNRHDGRDGIMDSNDVLFFDNRARLTVDGRLDIGIKGLIQLQDVRVWGEEEDTLFETHADGFDVHQAWAEIPLLLDGFKIRFGRQEMVFDEQRLVGAVGWTAQARSFDAIRLQYYNPEIVVGGEVFYAQLSDRETILPTTPNPEDVEKDTAGVAGAYVTVKAPQEGLFKHQISGYGLLDFSKSGDRERVTLGLYDKGSISIFKYRVEAYYQGGDVGGASINAFMFGGYAGVGFGETAKIDLLFWADYLSGAENPDEAGTRAFDTLYATNHAFYGHADFFLNVPKQTGGRGLVDLALKTRFVPVDGLTLIADFHHFRAAQPRDGEPVLGWEVDFTAKWKPWEQATLFVGVYTFVPGPGLYEGDGARLGGKDADIGVYSFAQVDI